MGDSIIKSVSAREVLDSRGNPTIEAEIVTKKGLFRAMVPSGKSTGRHEALELRDNNNNRFNGMGVLKAVKNVGNIIAKKLTGLDAKKQEELDNIMMSLDSTENKLRLGANAMLSVSMAACRAGAASKGVPLYRHISELFKTRKRFVLPVPFFNIINGGQHAGNRLDIQEYMIAPVGAKTFRQALQMGAETYYALKKIIRKKYGINAVNIGDEGGFSPPLNNAEEPIELILKAIKEAGYEKKIKIALDCAASSFYHNGSYLLQGKRLSSEKLLAFYEGLVSKYRNIIISIEDPFHEEDYKAYAEMIRALGKKIQVIGDDILATNIKRIQKAVGIKACNALLLKPNQIGTITECLEAARLALDNKWNVMVSHRSGETEDSFIADLAVGISCGKIKAGAPCRSERLAKYNQLLRIEEELGKNSAYG